MSHDSPDLGPDGPAALARYVLDTEYAVRGHVRIVARQVLQPLEEMHAKGELTDAQLRAGQRVRAALAQSWPQERVSMRWGYVSDSSDLDDDGEPLSEEEAWQRRAEAHATWRQAERVCGPECWPWVRGLAEGARLGSLGRADLVRRGLSALVREWRL